jgi:hypothetical protein
MARFVPEHVPTRDASANCNRFVVAQNGYGYWVARERSGLIEGVFLSQREAINFARLKTRRIAGATPPFSGNDETSG